MKVIGAGLLINCNIENSMKGEKIKISSLSRREPGWRGFAGGI
jgi:hypothetical protein